MHSFLDHLEQKLGPDDLRLAAKTLNNSYDPFKTDSEIWSLLSVIFPKDICRKFSKRMLGHEAVNEVLMAYYPGERVIKYHLVKDNLLTEDEVTIFEMYVDSSRVDIGRINGESHAYEIKTELDSLNKLSKQIADYSKAFEYIHLVVHERYLNAVLELSPDYCGIDVYYLHNGCWEIKTERSANFSPYIDETVQVQSLSSKDMKVLLKNADCHDIPKTKRERESTIFKLIPPNEIRELFKTVIKTKFAHRWDYLQQNFDRILPIDIQMFYKCNADPKWVYYKDSSIV